MKNCNSISLNGQPLKTDIETQLGYEIRLVTRLFNIGSPPWCRFCTSVFGAMLGTGTGGGIVINQHFDRTKRYRRWWGHNPCPAQFCS